MHLYYSPQCSHCLRLIEKYDFSSFQSINVQQHSVPPQITSVPTIVDDKYNTYVGNQAFVFMDSIHGIQPYSFDVTNLTNKGFSFIDQNPSEMFYSENCNYTELN